MLYTWPHGLVAAVRRVKEFFGLFSGHSILGLPLDWILRFTLLGIMYLVLRLRLSSIRAASLCIALLLATEFTELICTQHFPMIHAPDWGDLIDVLTGTAGIASAHLFRRFWRRRDTADPGAG